MDIGAGSIIPLINGHITAFGTRDKDHGVGDIFAAGIFQSDKKTLCLGSYLIPFYFRFVAGAASPSGNYDHDKIFNVGYNLYTFQFYCASTFFLTPKWELITRFMYNLHTTNTDYGPDQDNLKPGQLFNMNFSTSYQVRESIRLGVTGYYWRQTTDDKLNGHNLGEGNWPLVLVQELSWIGLLQKERSYLLLHSLFDTSVKNRPKGTTLQAHLIIPF